MYVYKIINKQNGDSYIGKTSDKIEKRFKRHCYLARSGAITHLYSAIRKYGNENFTIELIEETTQEHLNDREKFWISELNPEYNMTDGGDGGDISKSQSYLEYMKIRSELIRGQNNPFYGKKHTEEAKRKMSQKMSGRSISEEHKRKISEAQMGRKASAETVKKLIDINSKTWHLIDPNGNKITVKNLSEFCRQNGLDQRNMTKMYNGLQKTSKGYTRNLYVKEQ